MSLFGVYIFYFLGGGGGGEIRGAGRISGKGKQGAEAGTRAAKYSISTRYHGAHYNYYTAAFITQFHASSTLPVSFSNQTVPNLSVPVYNSLIVYETN